MFKKLINIVKDESEGFRTRFNMQIVKMKRVATVGSLILLALNLSFSVYPFVEHRFPEMVFGFLPRAWIGIPLLFVFIVLVIWFLAHIYMRKMEMYRTEASAEMKLSPYAVYAITPFEEMLYRVISIPTLKACYLCMPDGKEKEEIKRNLDMACRWVDLGYIPKKDFPKHLKYVYLTNKEKRL